MRQTMNILLALSTAPLGACGDDAPTATTAESPGLFDALLSRMGGVVVPTTDEDLFVEIIPEVDGKISALVLDEDGEIQQGGAAALPLVLARGLEALDQVRLLLRESGGGALEQRGKCRCAGKCRTLPRCTPRHRCHALSCAS